MDSGDTHEPSYYEVALTNRQVLIAFVALLTCLLVAFLSGVWIGRGGGEAATEAAASATTRQASTEPPLEQLTFFNGGGEADRIPSPKVVEPAVPAVSEAKPKAPVRESVPDASDPMRENLEATMAANRESPAMKLAAGERTPAAEAAAPARAGSPPPVAAAKPAAAPPAAVGKTFVQVYSSTNGARAREITAQLRKAGFPVVMAQGTPGGGQNFRVRVGPYESKNLADAAATRLRREHRLDTWVTDSP